MVIFWVKLIRVLMRRVNHKSKGNSLENQKSDEGEGWVVMIIKFTSISLLFGLNGLYMFILLFGVVKWTIRRVWEVQEGKQELGNLRTSFLDKKVPEFGKTSLLNHKDKSNNEVGKEITSIECILIPEFG